MEPRRDEGAPRENVVRDSAVGEDTSRKSAARNKGGEGSLSSVAARAAAAIRARTLAAPDSPVLLMVSGGSDSTALAYVACELREAGAVGPLAMLHVNHQLRGEDADADARFVTELAELLGIPLFMCEVDVAGEVDRTGDNMEAVARRERYLAANEALRSFCQHEAAPVADGRIFVAHTADDRVENFYMRSIVGTGPGGFRSMLYANGPVARPLLDVGRDDLRGYIQGRERQGLPVTCDEEGNLWREDATNAHTDKFRAYVRHEIVPRAKERNPRLLEVLGRTMNLIADEDDMLDAMTDDVLKRHVAWNECSAAAGIDYAAGCVLAPAFGGEPLPLQRRACMNVLQSMLGPDARVETASIDAVLAAYSPAGEVAGVPRGGYVTNVQGNLAVSANKHGVRIEPMAAFRTRRKR